MKIGKVEYKLPKKFKDKWVKALRSGKYKQGRSTMYCSTTDTLCCLAVAAVICGIDKRILEGHGCIGPCNNDMKNFNNYPKALIGTMDQPLIRKLTDFNDNKKKSFKWIASYIERYL